MNKSDLPTYDQLMLPTIQWLKEEGGSSRRQEIVLGVAILKDLSDAHLVCGMTLQGYQSLRTELAGL